MARCWLAALLLEGASPLLQAALLLALWVALTGALHLDGLADSADAWLGGFGDPARTLEIMKDPRSGPVAVVVLVLLLLLKFSALLVVLQAQQPARWSGAPARAHGAAGAVSLHPLCAPEWPRLAANLPRSRALIVLAMVVIGCLLLGATGLLALRCRRDLSAGASRHAPPRWHHGRYRRCAAGAGGMRRAGRAGVASGAVG